MSLDLCTAAFVAPVTTELALVARRIRGVGCASNDTRIVWLPMANPLPKDAHVYGAFNFAVGIGASGKSDQFIHAQAGPNICFMIIFFALLSGPGTQRRSTTTIIFRSDAFSSRSYLQRFSNA